VPLSRHEAVERPWTDRNTAGAVPRRILKSPVISSIHEQAKIMAALDFLFQGYCPLLSNSGKRAYSLTAFRP
jgi:hypothetical protein